MEAAGADLSFVNLGITIQNLPNSITVFGFRIAFYGIIIGLGMLAGMAVAFSDARRRGQDPDIYLDFALYGIIFSIIGARAYYVIFDWDNYKDNLLQIFNLRGGGLAIYGGVIGAVITLTVFTRMRKMSFFSMADSGVLGLITGQIIGRWGNFFNCEAFGVDCQLEQTAVYGSRNEYQPCNATEYGYLPSGSSSLHAAKVARESVAMQAMK